MLRFSANLSMLFNEIDFLDRFEAAARAGFSGVEYASPYEHDKLELATLLQRWNLEQALFNLPAGRWDVGERGLACLPGRTAEFRASVTTAIEYATALGCRRVNCLAGIAPAESSPSALRSTYVENIAFAAEQLKQGGIRLLIEAINTTDMPGYYLNNTRQAQDVLDEIGSDNLFIQYDAYHMQIMEGDLARTIERHFDAIGHIQIAGNPGRHEPDNGEINYPFLFSILEQLSYQEWVGAEYKPAAGTVAGLGWFAPFRRAPPQNRA